MRAAACWLSLLAVAALPTLASAHDWTGEPTGIFRTATLDRGEWIYTNGINQARGANTDGLHRTDYFPLNPHGDDPTHIPRDLHNALTYDAFGSDRSAHNGDFQLPTDATRFPHGTAGLAELRLAVQGDALHVRFLWESFPAPGAQIATLAFGSAASPQRTWPRNAHLTSGWDVALTAWGTGGVVTAPDGTETPVAVTHGDHVTEAVVPLSALPAGPWTLTGGAGLTDPAKAGSYWTVPAGVAGATSPGSGGVTTPTNVWDLLFADDVPWTFDERRQADDLAAGSAATDTATVDPADLRAHRTVVAPQRTGHLERLFTSAIDDGDGIERTGGTQIPQGNPGYGFDETWHYRGRLQPYGMHVPDRYPASHRAWPLIIHLHGFANYLDEPYYSPAGLVDEADRQGYLLASPLERGDYSYQDAGMADVLEVIADVRRHYDVDPDRIYLMGHSMGGYGTNRIGMHFPDLFAAIAPAQGTDTEELHANLRNVPWYEVTSLEDLDAGGQQATGLYDLLSADGYDATLVNYAMKIHEYSSIYENLPALFRFFGEHRRDPNPPVVSFTRPADDNPKLGLVFDGAYWVSGVRSAQGAQGTVTVTSEAIAHRVPDPAAAQRTREVVFDPDSPSKRSLGIRYRTTPGFQPAGPTSNTLVVDATSTAALTVDLDRAGLDRQDLRIVSHADGPVALTLHAAHATDLTITLPAGAGDRTL
ncbi:MAG: putative penicillin acylase [Solirubrobacterales bacterium]|nr:putative penicillin acylase [Solirubrobacterales bacterium]